MSLVRLHNEDWGFETNCFVCEPSNEHGLRIPFFHDTERHIVTAEFALDRSFSGAPTLVHGGVTLAVLDEAMAWACIAIGRQWAVTTETTTRFHRSIRVDETYRVEAEVLEQRDVSMTCRAAVHDGRDQIRAESEAVFTALGEAQVVRIVGIDLSDVERGFTTG